MSRAPCRSMRALRRWLGRLHWGLRGHLLWLSKKYLYALPTDEAPAPGAPAAARFRDAGADDLYRLTAADHGYDEAEKAHARHRLAQGDRLVVGLSSDDEVVISGWLVRGQVELGPRTFVPAGPAVAFSYHVHTVARHRGKRLMAAHYRHLARQLARQGILWLTATVEADNPAAIRGHEHAGFHRLGAYWELLLVERRLFFLPERLRQDLEIDRRDLLLRRRHGDRQRRQPSLPHPRDADRLPPGDSRHL